MIVENEVLETVTLDMTVLSQTLMCALQIFQFKWNQGQAGSTLYP